ncbi:MAG: DUF721 domain-containing protein [Nitrospiraceae bacterium]|nr:DUF721 domain-containing protein [Nitrospiraceae bacterium]
MKRIGTGLSGLVRKLGLEDAARLHGIKARWGELVGAPLSEHLEPGFVSGAMLHISVDSPLWLEQARFYSGEILKRVKPLGIGELKFKPGTRRKNVAGQASVKAASPMLSADELKQIEQCVCAVQDEGLKEIMREIMAKALRTPNGRTRISKQNP